MCKNNDIYNYDLIMIRVTKYIYNKKISLRNSNFNKFAPIWKISMKLNTKRKVRIFTCFILSYNAYNKYLYPSKIYINFFLFSF